MTDPMQVEALLSTGRCHPMCLLAMEPDGCVCRCHGKWHGALLGAEVKPTNRRDLYAVPPKRDRTGNLAAAVALGDRVLELFSVVTRMLWADAIKARITQVNITDLL